MIAAVGRKNTLTFITASARLEVGVKPVTSRIHFKKNIYILDILVSGLSMFYTLKGFCRRFSGSFCGFSILKFYFTDFLCVLFSTLVQ